MEAMALSEAGDFAQAQAKPMRQRESQRITGHDHFDLLRKDAAKPPFAALIHAESTRECGTLKVTAEVLALYQRLDQLTT